MKTIIWIALNLFCIAAGDPETSEADLTQKLSEYFLGLSLESDIAGLKKDLARNPDFKLYQDPNRNEATSITGSIAAYKHINPASTRNQLFILITPDGSKEHAIYKLSIDYKLTDLPIAMHDWEQIKKDFRPFFTEASEKTEIGYHQEEIETLSLTKGNSGVIIRIVKFNSINHTISFEYKVTRRTSIR